MIFKLQENQIDKLEELKNRTIGKTSQDQKSIVISTKVVRKKIQQRNKNRKPKSEKMIEIQNNQEFSYESYS